MGKKHLIAAEAEGDQRSLWGEAWRRFKKNRLAMIGMYFILALVIIAIATIIIDAVTGKSIYLNYVVKQQTAAVRSTMTSLLLEAGRLRKSMALSSN